MLFVMHHVVCCHDHTSKDSGNPCMRYAAGNPCEQEAPAILQSIELALQRKRSSAWVVPEAQGSPGPASGRSALFCAAAVCMTSRPGLGAGNRAGQRRVSFLCAAAACIKAGQDPACSGFLLPWHSLPQCMPVAAALCLRQHPNT